jgi:hypothetical protein
MKNLAKSLSKFHDLMGGLEKDASNPFFKSKYVTLDNVLTSIKSPLKEAGLVFFQLPSVIAGQPALATTLIDIESGEFINETSSLILQKNDIQGQGSAITYMRRYALVSMLGLSTDTDDDGEGALRRTQSSTEDMIDMDERFNGAISNDRV